MRENNNSSLLWTTGFAAVIMALLIGGIWQFRSTLILGLMLGLLALLVSAGLILRQRTLKAHYRTLYQSEAALRASLERQSVTLHAIGDAVIATDAQGNVELMNPAAESLTGWTEEEAQGKSLSTVFSIINEESRQPVEDPATRVLREGETVGLANHTLLIARDGREIPIADSGAPIRDDAGHIIGVVLVFRDQSEERLTQRLTGLRLELITYAENHTLDQLITRALDSVGSLVNSPIGFYHFMGNDEDTISLQQWSTRTLNEFCQAEGKGKHYPIAKAGVWADCVRQKRTIVHNDYVSLHHKKGMPEGHAKVVRELVTPVLRENKVVAILGVGNKPTNYTEKDVEIVSYFADVTWEIVRRKRVEEALRESEERFRKSFDTELVAWAISRSRDGVYIEANPGFLKMTGYAYDELIGRTSQQLDFFTPTQRQALIVNLEESGRIHNQELTFPTKHGDLRTIIFSIGPITIEGEACLVATMVDITERKQAEQALRESEERYRALFESANDAILLMKEEIVVACNEAAVHTFGCKDKSDILGRSPWTFSPAKQPDGQDSKQKARSLMQSAIKEDVQYFEWTSTKKDGTPFPVEVSLNRLTVRGEPLVQTIVRDITARKQAEQERDWLIAQVQEQARQMKQVLATVPTGVLLLDADRRILQANPVAEEDLLTLTKTQVGGILTKLGDRSLVELLTSPPTKGLWHEVKGEQGIFEVIARPVENGPSPERWVLVIKDVTQERETRERLQQQERLAAVGQLASGIAHDFNNIMAVIVLFAQMELYTPNLSHSSREHLQTISQQAKRATDLIQQILDFSRSAVLERRPLDLAPFLKEVIKLLERTVPESIEIDLDIGAEEYIVNVDPTRVQQTIMNLAVNARDAMPAGGELRIILSRTTKAEEIRCTNCGRVIGGEWVSIAVTDTGDGIPRDVLPHIFEPFFTTKEVGQGTGLGLAQVYGIVKQHEGHIDVVTENGEGTTFLIYLPALPIHQPNVINSALPTYIRGQGETILVVEDDAILRTALIETLEGLNYRVLEAANGRKALHILSRHNEVALVLSDLVMPEMGGQALFHAMRSRNLMQPVVMLSGHPMEDQLEDLQAKGLAGWLHKPVRREDLAKLVTGALNKE